MEVGVCTAYVALGGLRLLISVSNAFWTFRREIRIRAQEDARALQLKSASDRQTVSQFPTNAKGAVLATKVGVNQRIACHKTFSHRARPVDEREGIAVERFS